MASTDAGSSEVAEPQAAVDEQLTRRSYRSLQDFLTDNIGDDRSPTRRDHDRVFYSAEFARLEGITQVATVTASTIHNRLTHSYRVEQVARSIVLRLNAETKKEAVTDTAILIDEDAVAASALGHDIGHSPFGHTGEEALQQVLVCKFHRDEKKPRNFEGRRGDYREYCSPGHCILPDSFEGNAQSFRILTRLAPKKDPGNRLGRDLTRLTSRAGLKYPWLKGDNEEKLEKWGAYDCDRSVLEWVLNDGGHYSRKSVEAQIMDTADDIAYAVHDLEDFYRANVIPLSEVRVGTPVFEDFLEYIRADSDKSSNPRLRALADEYFDGLRELRGQNLDEAVVDAAVAGSDLSGQDPDGAAASQWAAKPRVADIEARLQLLPDHSYVDDVDGRALLVRVRSDLISKFVGDLTRDDNGNLGFVHLAVETYMDFLKQLTWYYVINDPDLVAIRAGQAKVTTLCFSELYKAALEVMIVEGDGGSKEIRATTGVRTLPPRLLNYIDIVRQYPGPYGQREQIARAVTDYICSLTDREMYALASRVSGSAAFSLPASLSGLQS